MPFDDIIGHGNLLAILGQAVARDRVPQSLLFAGPDGVGKRAVALALAQALNCPIRHRKGGTDACGRCPTCARIAAGRHSDVVLLDKGDEASIKIKPLRERVLEVVGYRPFEARYRVFIIDPADALTKETQDALLKTLEEPPSAAIIILISAHPDTLLPTVLSRCRRLRFGPLADADVMRVLVETLGVESGQARVLAAAAGGSPARAMAEDSGALAADREAALGLLAAAGSSAVAARLSASAALARHGSRRRDREALSQRLAFVASLLRDLGLLASGRGEGLANADLTAALDDLRRAFPIERASEGFAAVARARLALDRNASPKIVADWLAVNL
jgi:DNA polymerase-3 subunit delta'